MVALAPRFLKQIAANNAQLFRPKKSVQVSPVPREPNMTKGEKIYLVVMLPGPLLTISVGFIVYALWQRRIFALGSLELMLWGLMGMFGYPVDFPNARHDLFDFCSCCLVFVPGYPPATSSRRIGCAACKVCALARYTI